LSLSGKSDGAVKIVIAPSSIQYLDQSQLPERVRVSLKGQTADLRPGQRVRLKAMLSPPPEPVLPGTFDFARAAWFEGVGASGFSRGKPEILAPSEPKTLIETWSVAVADWRFTVADRIRKALPGVEGTIAAALIAGDRGFIPEDDLDALRDSSLAHMLSISGLHMAIIGLGLFGFVRLVLALLPRIALRTNTKKLAAAIALTGTFLYLILSGSSVPAIRSFMMIGLMFVAVMVDRPAITMRTVALAGALILLVAPESLLDPSFQMSFGAVVALVAAHEALVHWREERGTPLVPPGIVVRGATYVGGAALTSLVAGLATAPFAAFHFSRFATYGMAANVLSMPVMGFVVMPLGAAALLLMPFGLEAYALEPMGWGIRIVLEIAHWVADWPGAVVAAPAWPLGALLLSVLGGLWLTIWRGSWRLLGLVPVLFAILWSLVAPTPDIIIDSEGKNIAILGQEGRYQLYDDVPKFEVERWLERVGDARTPNEIKSSAPGLKCNEQVCELKVRRDSRSWRIAFIPRDAKGTSCPRADILVAYDRPDRCKGTKLTLDSKALREGGPHIVWFNGKTVRAESVTGSRGVRPWVIAD
jgi:competence protein ComEC